MAACAAAVLLVVLLMALPGVSPDRSVAQAATAGELNQRLEDTRVQLQQLRAKIAKAEAARKAALGDVAALDQQVEEQEREVRLATAAYESAANALAEIRAKLAAVSKELSQKRAELRKTETDLATQQDVFGSRIADLYKSGGRVAFAAAFLQPGSIGEAAERIALLRRIVDRDNAILAEIQDLKAKVVVQEQALASQRAEVAEVEQRQVRATEDLAAKAKERQGALDALMAAKKAKQKVVAEAERNLGAWNRQEDELLAESERIGDLLRSASSGNPSPVRGALFRPVPGDVTSGFGYRIHPIFHVRKMHTGVDMHADMGEPIHAAAAGTVVQAGWRGGYGKCVVIDHGNGLATLYGHQSEILVSVGQKVKKGEVIGKVGSTGYSTGPHLHFEVRVNGSPVDPAGYL
jgi:murein DD-endopeptidase MepM/ murein hydrolase activator NlpD